MDDRERVIEECRAALAAAFLTRSFSGRGGCDTCDFGAEEGMTLETISEVLDEVKKNSLRAKP